MRTRAPKRPILNPAQRKLLAKLAHGHVIMRVTKPAFWHPIAAAVTRRVFVLALPAGESPTPLVTAPEIHPGTVTKFERYGLVALDADGQTLAITPAGRERLQ